MRMSSFRLLELTCQNGVFVGSDCNNNALYDETRVKRGDTVGIGAEFAHDNTLGGRFAGERDEDPLHLVPFLDNEPRVEFPAGFEQHVSILRRMLEAIEGLADFR